MVIKESNANLTTPEPFRITTQKMKFSIKDLLSKCDFGQ